MSMHACVCVCVTKSLCSEVSYKISMHVYVYVGNVHDIVFSFMCFLEQPNVLMFSDHGCCEAP